MGQGEGTPSAGEGGPRVEADGIAYPTTLRRVKDVARWAVELARRLTGADGAAFVVNEDEFCHYLDEAGDLPGFKGERFAVSSCIAGWTMRNTEAAIIPDVFADSRIAQPVYRATKIKALALVPVSAAGAEAAIGAYWSSIRQPTGTELAALSAIARAAARALDQLDAGNQAG